jgi:hypothetical protein
MSPPAWSSSFAIRFTEKLDLIGSGSYESSAALS